MELAPGLVGEVTIVVRPEDTADALGNPGVHALATPRLVALLEQAAIAALSGRLPADAGSVGSRLDIKHLAATPVGMRVLARATLRAVDGRRLTYEVEAHDDLEKIAEGTHERFQVSQARFLERIAEKAKRR